MKKTIICIAVLSATILFGSCSELTYHRESGTGNAIDNATGKPIEKKHQRQKNYTALEKHSDTNQ